MEYRKIATGMIEDTYESFKQWQDPDYMVEEDDNALDYELNKHEDIPVWCKMDTASKCAAIEYVYANRNEIELHSGYVSSMVQAAAYFMIYDFVAHMAGDTDCILDIGIFFDDLDFTFMPELCEENHIGYDYVFPEDGSKAGPDIINLDSIRSKMQYESVDEDNPS